MKTITIVVDDRPQTVPCEPTGVPGLVVHRAPGTERLRSPLWVLAHLLTGYALAHHQFFLGRGEARLVAERFGPFGDWAASTPDVSVGDVRVAFESGMAWRTNATDAIRNLVYTIGDRVIVPAGPVCDGRWHRISFGWGQTAVRRPATRVLLLSATGRDELAMCVQCHEPVVFVCLDCAVTV